MKIRLRIAGWALGISGLLAAVVATSAVGTPGGWFAVGQVLAGPQSQAVVATVNGAPLTAGDLAVAVAKVVHIEGRADTGQALRQTVLQDLIRDEVVYQAATAAGFRVSEREAAADLLDQLQRGSGTTQIKELLAGTGKTVQQFAATQSAIDGQRRALTIGRYRYSVVGALLDSDPHGAAAAWERHVDGLMKLAVVVIK